MSQILNVEFKAKVSNLLKIKKKLLELSADDRGIDHQVDYYFNTEKGRLKLRKGNVENSLIYYEREDSAGPKASFIRLEKLSMDNSLEKVLEVSNGIKVIVDKKRNIFFIGNVKFHLDEVQGLGTFFEIEAIDEDGSIGEDKLHAQCDHYLNLFEIKESDFINVSYSDLILKNELYKKGEKFLEEVEEISQNSFDINLLNYKIDHLCFRVETLCEYHYKKLIFEKLGSLLVESIVGGRMIATYKLHEAIIYKNQKIDVIELPSPKENSFYKSGFEHAELVIAKSFEDFMRDFPSLDFDTSATTKSHNPELRLKLGKGYSVKFHHQSLEETIFQELRGK